MKVSVIIPVYNVEKFVLRCIESIINQTMTEGVECIIVNDCTPDKSMEIIQQRLANYHGKIQFKIINHERNRGLAVVRNTGIDNAKGDYIIHIDSDDWCEPDMLEKMYQKAIEDDADMVIADYYESYEDKEVYQYGQSSNTENDYIRALFRGKIPCMVWNKMIKLTCILNNRLTNIEQIDLREDYCFIFQILLTTNKIKYLPSAFVHYTLYNCNSYTYKISNNYSKKLLNNYIKLEEYLTKIYTAHNLYKRYKKEIANDNLFFRYNVLIRTFGKVQKQYNSLYNKNFPLFMIFQKCWMPLYWKIGLLFASWNMLFIFNTIRYIQIKSKNIRK